MQREYTPKEIADLIGGPHRDAGSLARTVEAFWPTIKAALENHDGPAVKPLPSNA